MFTIIIPTCLKDCFAKSNGTNNERLRKCLSCIFCTLFTKFGLGQSTNCPRVYPHSITCGHVYTDWMAAIVRPLALDEKMFLSFAKIRSQVKEANFFLPWAIPTTDLLCTCTISVGVLTRMELCFYKYVLIRLLKCTTGAVECNRCMKESTYNRCTSQVEVGAAGARRA